ncbi:MAG TPA: tetratricopeptide repeat protein [Stellaceae bacterium]|jgi:tetratricopeptide (TPR) repeat protein|nr:tetratricopeptide repeat protein [Stellaceae bacterium]
MAVFDSKLMDKAKSAAILISFVLCACATTAAKENDPPPAAARTMSPLGAYLAARHAQQERDYGDAARFIDQALAADPGNMDLVRRSFLFRVGGGDVASALPLARRIADLDRHSGFADLVLVLQEMKAGHYDVALRRANDLPHDGVERLVVPLLAAWAEMGQGEIAPALATLAEAKAPNALPELIQLHSALIADMANRIDEAAGQYDKLTRDPAHLTWRTVELAGNFYERHQRATEARKLYQRLAADSDSDAVVEAALKRLADGTIPKRLIDTPQDGAAEVLFDLASMLNQRDTMDVALIYGQLSLYLRPHFAIAQLLLAEIADELNHREQALALYRSVDRASPLAWSARLREAAMLDGLDRTDEAVALLRQMAAERPRDRQPAIELGDILRSHDRFKEAVTAYDEAFARFGNAPHDWRLYYSRGIALERSQQWPRAEADLRRALELEPEQPLVLNYLGYSWIDQGVHLDQALHMVERAVALRPNDGYIVDSLGWAYYRLGRYTQAAENLEHAIELVPEDPTINDHLGDAYWRTGRHLEARFQWNRALQFKPEAGEKVKIDAKLEHGLGQAVTVAPPAKGG